MKIPVIINAGINHEDKTWLNLDANLGFPITGLLCLRSKDRQLQWLVDLS